MSMIIYDMEATIEIGDTFKNPKFRKQGKPRMFAGSSPIHPMGDQDWFTGPDNENDELDQFRGCRVPRKIACRQG